MASPTRNRDWLFELLPVVVRQADAVLDTSPTQDRGGPLKALLRIVARNADFVDADIRRLWDDYFVETCDEWIVPYIGDLIGNRLLHSGVRPDESATAEALFTDLAGPRLRGDPVIRLRADVAKTISYRRRKGTIAMLEELARDVTGWPAHAVEFFELLDWSQNLEHLRLDSHECAELRDVERIDRVHGPFDIMSHQIDVRPIGQFEGWYDVRNLGFFLWRLGSHRLIEVEARPGAQVWQFHFSPLGHQASLFSRWRREDQETVLATEVDVAGPIRPAAFFADLRRFAAQPIPPPFTNFYGPPEQCSFQIQRGGIVPPAEIRCQNLENWVRPVGLDVGVDPRRGRIAFGDGWGNSAARVLVSYHYGFSAEMGGGSYPRSRWLARPQPPPHAPTLQLSVAQGTAIGSLAAAVAEWTAQGKPDVIVTIADSLTYREAVALDLQDGTSFVLQAKNGARPLLIPTGGTILATGDHPESMLTLSGLLIEGGVQLDASLRRLRVIHSTLVPGRALSEDGLATSTDSSIVAAGAADQSINASLEIEIAFSIVGPIRAPGYARRLWILDSIVDGIPDGAGGWGSAIADSSDPAAAGPPLHIERSTLFGDCHVRLVHLGSESVFVSKLIAEQRQEGCVRFSYVSRESRTPRRYHCQPQLEIATQKEVREREALRTGTTLPPGWDVALADEIANWLVPGFTSTRYGQPAYAQLGITSPIQIRTGAEDESEMGAFCHLKQPQREANLRMRLTEYLPVGLEPGLMYVT